MTPRRDRQCHREPVCVAPEVPICAVVLDSAGIVLVCRSAPFKRAGAPVAARASWGGASRADSAAASHRWAALVLQGELSETGDTSAYMAPSAPKAALDRRTFSADRDSGPSLWASDRRSCQWWGPWIRGAFLGVNCPTSASAFRASTLGTHGAVRELVCWRGGTRPPTRWRQGCASLAIREDGVRGAPPLVHSAWTGRETTHGKVPRPQRPDQLPSWRRRVSLLGGQPELGRGFRRGDG